MVHPWAGTQKYTQDWYSTPPPHQPRCAAACLPACPSPALLQVQQCAASLAGNPEALVAVFAALVRAQVSTVFRLVGTWQTLANGASAGRLPCRSDACTSAGTGRVLSEEAFAALPMPRITRTKTCLEYGVYRKNLTCLTCLVNKYSTKATFEHWFKLLSVKHT